MEEVASAEDVLLAVWQVRSDITALTAGIKCNTRAAHSPISYIKCQDELWCRLLGWTSEALSTPLIVICKLALKLSDVMDLPSSRK